MIDKESILKAALNEISNFKIFAGLDINTIHALCKDGEIATTSHRDTLFKFGEKAGFFGIVLSGAYKLSRPTPGGEDVIMNFATTGDIVAAFIMTQVEPIYPVSAIAMGPSRFLKLSRKIYLERWKNYPDIIFRIQNLLSARMAFFQKQKSLTKAPLSAKVAALLIEILQKNDSKDKLTLSLPLTRKEIADNLGASVESVIRIMSLWSKNNIIETRDHEIAILKLDKLIEFANE